MLTQFTGNKPFNKVSLRQHVYSKFQLLIQHNCLSLGDQLIPIKSKMRGLELHHFSTLNFSECYGIHVARFFRLI